MDSGYDLRSALRARSGLLGKEVSDLGPSSTVTRSQTGACGLIESGERRWDGVEFGAVAKAMKVDSSDSRGKICLSALAATRHLTSV